MHYSLISSWVLGLGLALGGVAHAQDFPNKPIHIITEYSPGSGGDVFFRALATHFSSLSAQPWVVDNRPGAGAMLAVDAATRATPDGYTILVASQNVPVTRLFLSKGETSWQSWMRTPMPRFQTNRSKN